MLGYYINDIAERLATRKESDGWQVKSTILLGFVSGQLKESFENRKSRQHCIALCRYKKLSTSRRHRISLDSLVQKFLEDCLVLVGRGYGEQL